jgi:hypothetical protein
MSELPDLPPAPRREHAPTASGLEVVTARGRLRRRMALGTGGTAAAVAVALVVVAGTGGATAEDGLGYADDPDPVVSTARALTKATATATPSATSAPADPEPTATPDPTGAPDPGPTEQPDGEPEEPAGPPAFREQPVDVAAPVSCTSTYDPSRPPFQGGGVCTEGQGTTDVHRVGAEISASYAVCVSRRGKALELGFAGGQEHEVVVRRGHEPDGPVISRFSQTVTYPQGAHSRTIQPGRCLQWRGAWDSTIDGELAPPGRYTVTVSAEPSSAYGQALEPGAAGGITMAVTLTDDEEPGEEPGA